MPAVPMEVLSALTSAGVAPVHPTEKWASWGQQRAQGCSHQKLAGSVGRTENKVRGTEGDAPLFYLQGKLPIQRFGAQGVWGRTGETRLLWSPATACPF